MTQITQEFIHTKGKPEKLVVFLHGYEQTAALINKLIPPFLDNLDNCVVAIPASPHACEIASNKCQWYSMQDFDPHNLRKTSTDFNEVIKIYEKSHSSIKPSFDSILIYIEKKLKEYKIKPKNLYICGFSQGATLSLYTALMFNEKIGGVVSISGMLSPAEVLLYHHKNSADAILIHGKKDSFVNFSALEYSKKYLEKMGCAVSTYAMDDADHFITQDALFIASGFINAKK